MVRVKSTLIKTAGDQIAELPQQDTVTPYEMIKELAPIIIEARKRGHDFRAIAKILEGHGRATRVSDRAQLLGPRAP